MELRGSQEMVKELNGDLSYFHEGLSTRPELHSDILTRTSVAETVTVIPAGVPALCPEQCQGWGPVELAVPEVGPRVRT